MHAFCRLPIQSLLPFRRETATGIPSPAALMNKRFSQTALSASTLAILIYARQIKRRHSGGLAWRRRSESCAKPLQ